jgi:hypothetical protein
VLGDVPVRKGYLEALAGVSSDAGPFARLEAGYRPFTNLGLFSFAEWTPSSAQAGAGARLTFPGP